MSTLDHLTAEQYHDLITARKVLPEHQNICRVFASTPLPLNPYKDLLSDGHSPAPPKAIQDS